MADYKRGDTASWDKEQVRQSERSRQSAQQTGRKRRRRRRVNPLLYALCVVLSSAILAGVGWLLASDLCAFNKEAMTTTVEITADDSIGSVADKLQEAGLIKYKWFFRLFAAVANADEKIGMGTYELNTEMDYRALIMAMQSSSGNMNSNTVTVTIPEGYTVMQTIQLLAKNGVATEEALLEAAKTYDFSYDFIDNASEDLSRLEGYLFPDTYEFYTGDKAGTYGMLQIDASLLYGLEDHEGTITNADLQTDTPYNLYKYAGLPPTPIANPGLASIEAALEPESTDYYYYALGTDGLHHFFTNYSDFTSFLNSDQYGG